MITKLSRNPFYYRSLFLYKHENNYEIRKESQSLLLQVFIPI